MLARSLSFFALSIDPPVVSPAPAGLLRCCELIKTEYLGGEEILNAGGLGGVVGTGDDGVQNGNRSNPKAAIKFAQMKWSQTISRPVRICAVIAARSF